MSIATLQSDFCRSKSIEKKNTDSGNRAIDNVSSDIIFAPPNLGLLSTRYV